MKLRLTEEGTPTPPEPHGLYSTDHPDVNGSNTPRGGDVLTYNGSQAKWEGAPPVQASLAPPGSMVMFGGPTPPAGWLACNGAAVSRGTFPALFEAIGTAYGAGDGSTTFNLPDLRGRVPMGPGAGPGLTVRAIGDKPGEEEHQLTVQEMPAHAHASGFSQETNTATAPNAGSRLTGPGTASVVTSGSAGDSVPHNNLQPALVVRFVIKA